MDQTLEPLTFIVGMWFVKMGIRKRDRSINRLLNIYNEWSKSYITQKIKNFKERYNNSPGLKPKDLIETIIAQNIKA